MTSLKSFFEPSELEPAKTDVEGAFRRGYQHAVAAVVELLSERPNLSAADLNDWERGALDRWRKDQPLDRQIPPPIYKPT